MRVEDLTLREKIGQTCIFRHMLLDGITDVKDYFTKNPIGATWPMGHPKEVYRYVETALGNHSLEGDKNDFHVDYENLINTCMKVPVIPVMDATSGINPLFFPDHEALPTPASIGAAADEELAFEYGKAIGEDYRSIGFRWMWSPVCDNKGKYGGLRTMCSDSELLCKLLTAFIRGLHAAGVATGAKHFPGEDPYEYRDSHFCTASYSQSYEYWEKTQKREFQACIDAGTDSVMIGHKCFKAVDDTRVNGALLPATLSYKVITELLKGKMGFKGVVLTDDVDMKALTAIYPKEKLYVELLRAGNDMILGPERTDYIDIIEKAVLSGDLPESRIDDACRRVLALKEKYGILDGKPTPRCTPEKRKEINAKLREVGRRIAEKGMTLTANHTNLIPVDRNKIRRVKMVYIGYSDLCLENLQCAVEEFAKYGAVCELQNGFCAQDNDTLDEYDLIVYANYIGMHKPTGGEFFFGKECNMLRQIMTVGVEKSVGVSFGNPDIYFNYFTAARSFVNCYSLNKETIKAFVRGLYGDVKFTDHAPFPLNPITCTDEVY